MSAKLERRGTSEAIDKNPMPDPERWLQEFGDYLFHYALQRLHDAAHAEDMVQETLVAALHTRENYTGRSSEKTWLTGILKHKIIDFIRKQVRESTIDDINALSDATIGCDTNNLFDSRGHWIRPPQNWGNPDKMLQNSQFIEAFEQCLKRLKPILARIFTLKELTGLTTKEICNELGITATNSNVMLYRARMSLRRCLELRWSGTNSGES